MVLRQVFKKPILVGGLGVCALLGWWESWQGQGEEISQGLLWGLSGISLTFWWWRRGKQKSLSPTFAPLTREQLQKAIAEGEKGLGFLQHRVPELNLADLRAALATVKEDALNATPSFPSALNGVILGEKRTGKSTLLALMPSQLTVDEKGPLPFNWQAIPAETAPEDLAPLLRDAHWVLVLTTGDLTQSQWQLLKFLQQQHHHWQVVFNKQDRYPEGDRQTILEQLQLQVSQLSPPAPVLAISAAPQPIQIRRHLPDGTIETDHESVLPHLGDLLSQFETGDLTPWQTRQLGVHWRQCQAIQREARQRWRENRRALAMPLIEQAQWLSAGAALVNPVANLDLLAAIAIQGQLVGDLGQIYHQPLSLSQAKTVATQLGELLVKLGLVELSTQALGALLKSQPLTYLAGGAIQGLSAAYLTRIAGLSLVAFLENQGTDLPVSQWDWNELGRIVQHTFEQNQRLSVLQSFFQRARQQLTPPSPQTLPAEA